MKPSKTIINHCSTIDMCVLKIDGRYFGYDHDPAYPESSFDDLKDAFVFASQKGALEITSWFSGKRFEIIPFVHPRIYKLGDIVLVKKGQMTNLFEVNKVEGEGVWITNGYVQMFIRPEELTLICKGADRKDEKVPYTPFIK